MFLLKNEMSMPHIRLPIFRHSEDWNSHQGFLVDHFLKILDYLNIRILYDERKLLPENVDIAKHSVLENSSMIADWNERESVEFM